MASFGRLTVSGIAGSNENTVALANFNIDFSLLKVVPPKEFIDVGNSLSAVRKHNAEEGHIHQTARKLGAIFEPILPSTPQLVRRYGTRASEIAQKTAASIPKAQGMFTKQSGIDAASIWAAATSGSGALQIHLLACMLARIWEQKDAISIWEEILQSRKLEIQESFQNEGSMSVAACTSYLASLQTITRIHIGEWDDSARSWLRIADRSPTILVRQNQLDQIVGRSRNAVSSRPSLYGSVIEAWKIALEGTERLLNGSPQNMQTGGLLLGLSAWHLYPDINLLGDPNMFSEFRDPLVPKSGILTIGMVGSATLTEGLHWSLPLAHLRYYGDPIPRTGRLRGVRNRISLSEFMQSVLGCLLEVWKTNESTTESVLKWIVTLKEKITRAQVAIMDPKSSQLFNSTWLVLLAGAAQEFLDSKGDDRSLNRRLINAGRLYGSKALLGKHPTPFFGLSQTLHYFNALKHVESKVSFLRELLKNQTIYKDHVIIRYYSSEGEVEKKTIKSDVFMGSKKPVDLSSTSGKEDEENVPIAIPYAKIKDAWTLANEDFEARRSHFESLGEVVYSIEDEKLTTLEKKKSMRVVWGDLDQLDNTDLDPWHWSPLYGEVRHFSPCFGDFHDISLFLRMNQEEPVLPETVEFRTLEALFLDDNGLTDAVLSLFIDGICSLGTDCVRSLRAIATIHKIYEPLPSATIAIKLLELNRPLSRAHWLPKDPAKFCLVPYDLQLPETFSCILLCESGMFDVPSSHMMDTMAISSGDSMYIAAPLLTDPMKSRSKLHKIRHVMGNIGRAGTALLQAPLNPKIRTVGVEQWTYISSEDWDGNRRDSFKDTSLHLWFTGSSIAIDGRHVVLGEKDTELYLLESVVSVHGRGLEGPSEWIADLDILKALRDSSLNFDNYSRDPSSMTENSNHETICARHTNTTYNADVLKLIAIENWIELLETRAENNIFLAKGNWQARQAATAISIAQGRKTCVLQGITCWACVAEQYEQVRQSGQIITFIA
ncbi:hypothetical protein K491DRAFT_584819 [Lophiostoma macrostomum CBS 122681]|uniref:Uncharacterized protein n=1 Tax=Lophiostoma macrostomum CBS 122681 TaxID=1314788 RepID=A0A6A6TUF0_9PLEO|nr:hypothetical protein K491DRAFT_584819 [Lophiostoma macrostomum CBS 122681]